MKPGWVIFFAFAVFMACELLSSYIDYVNREPTITPQLKPETSGPRYLNFTCEENC